MDYSASVNPQLDVPEPDMKNDEGSCDKMEDNVNEKLYNSMDETPTNTQKSDDGMEDENKEKQERAARRKEGGKDARKKN